MQQSKQGGFCRKYTINKSSDYYMPASSIYNFFINLFGTVQSTKGGGDNCLMYEVKWAQSIWKFVGSISSIVIREKSMKGMGRGRRRREGLILAARPPKSGTNSYRTEVSSVRAGDHGLLEGHRHSPC